jgi:hypothetical protein
VLKESFRKTATNGAHTVVLLLIEPVHPAYNPSFQLVFLAGTVFFSHNKSVNSVFQSAY